MQVRRLGAVALTVLVAAAVGYALVFNAGAHQNEGLDLRVVAKLCLGLGFAILIYSGVKGQRTKQGLGSDELPRNG
jgi:hypothetical protein